MKFRFWEKGEIETLDEKWERFFIPGKLYCRRIDHDGHGKSFPMLLFLDWTDGGDMIFLSPAGKRQLWCRYSDRPERSWKRAL